MEIMGLADGFDVDRITDGCIYILKGSRGCYKSKWLLVVANGIISA